MELEALKQEIRSISSRYQDREQRSRRLFIEDKAVCLKSDRHREFIIKSDISHYFSIPYTSISFCGSGQLGFSVHKDKLFEPGISDLDVACISADLFQKAWMDVVNTTNAFTDLSKFSPRTEQSVEKFKDQILKRGMINIGHMPQSMQKVRWSQFEMQLSRKHKDLFGKITIAVYMNEYAFCWKQDSAISNLVD